MIIRGNWWCGSGKASCTPAFNEAADDHPRKPDDGDKTIRERIPSMRPRMIIRGNKALHKFPYVRPCRLQ